eukprot:331027-Chlamydomonas_euryale.AAC.5
MWEVIRESWCVKGPVRRHETWWLWGVSSSPSLPPAPRSHAPRRRQRGVSSPTSAPAASTSTLVWRPAGADIMLVQ